MTGAPQGVSLKDEAVFGGDLVVRRYALDNGLTVILLRDVAAPIFSMNTWFRVGSRNEKPGTTGIAHLFEHLMFKETRNHPEGEFDRLMEARGAITNAGTWLDWTFYKETLGKDDLDLALDLESDRMTHLILNQSQLDAERGVVENERRMVVDDSLHGTMGEKLYSLAFRVHPYRWPTIGWAEDLKAITVDDCMGFYRTYYSPGNAVLVLVGDLDEEATLRRIQERYGVIPPQTIPVYTPTPEPPQGGERREEMRWPTPTHKLVVGYRCPPFMDPKTTALGVLNVVMSGGRSSRLFRRLVLEEELVSEVDGSIAPLMEPGLFDLTLSLNEGADPSRVEAVLRDEEAKVLQDGITEAELEKARNTLEAEFYKQLVSASDRAYSIGFYEVSAGDHKELFTRVAATRAITREEVLAVARETFVADSRITILASPAGSGSSGTAAGAPPRSVLAPEGSYNLQVLPDVSLIGETRRDLPMASVNVYIRSGGFTDPAGKEGLAYLTGEALLTGADGLKGEEISETVEALGGCLSVNLDHECTALSAQVLARNLEPLMDILRKVITRPTFLPDEIARRRSLQEMDILGNRDSDAPLARRFFRQGLFKGHVLGRPLVGWLPSVRSITRDDVIAFYREHYRKENMLVSAYGDVSPDRLRGLVARALEGLPSTGAGALPRAGSGAPAPRPGRHLILVDKPDRTQNHFVIGHPAIRGSHPDWITLLVGITAFGGTFTSRLMDEIRTKRGWTYGAHAALPRTRLGDGLFLYTYTATPETPDALALCLKMYEELIGAGITEVELEASRDYLYHQFPFSIDIAEKRVSLRVEQILKDLPADFIDGFRDQVKSVTLSDVNRALATHLQHQDLTVSMVCTATELKDKVEKIPGWASIRVLPFDWEGPLPD